MLIFKNLRDFSSLCKESSEKTWRNDVDLFSLKKIEFERRFVNAVNEKHGLRVHCLFPVFWATFLVFTENPLKKKGGNKR